MRELPNEKEREMRAARRNKLKRKMRKMKVDIKGGNFRSNAPHFRKWSPCIISVSIKEDSSLSSKESQHSKTCKIFTPLVEPPSVLLVKLQDVELIKKIQFHKIDQSS